MPNTPILDLDGMAMPNNKPTDDEIRDAMEDALIESGIVPEAVDIIEGEHTLPQMGVMTPRVFPVHLAVVKQTGMVLFFAAAGPAGIHARVLAKRESESEPN